MVEHTLPKPDTRVRFPSVALHLLGDPPEFFLAGRLPVFCNLQKERQVMLYTSTIDVKNALSGEDVLKLAFQSDDFDLLKDFVETTTGARLIGASASTPTRDCNPGNDNLSAEVTLGVTDTVSTAGYTVRRFPWGVNGGSEALYDVLEGYAGQDLVARLNAWRSDVAA